MEGWMVDARLTVSIPELPTKPDFMLEYTYFSGDDSETDGDYEGWDGIFAEYPIYREELLPILNNGNWTNLHQFRLQGKCTLFSNPECGLVKNVTLTGSYAHLRADEADTGYTSGGGTGDSHFGDLFTAFLDVKLNEYVTVSLEAAAFESGAYWSTDENSKWLRFQTVISF
jgi:hypothetical protein